MTEFSMTGTARIASGAATAVTARRARGILAAQPPATLDFPQQSNRAANASGAATFSNCCDRFAPGPLSGFSDGGRGASRSEQNPQVPLASEDAFLWQVPGNAETAVGTLQCCYYAVRPAVCATATVISSHALTLIASGAALSPVALPPFSRSRFFGPDPHAPGVGLPDSFQLTFKEAGQAGAPLVAKDCGLWTVDCGLPED